jgi:O-antigen ligase
VALEQYDEAALDAVLARIAAGGLVWVRQPFYWTRIDRGHAACPDCTDESLTPSAAEFEWAATDRVVAALARYPQLRLVAVLDDAPPTPPQAPDRFADFAAAFAERYADQIDHYQIWDEPNLAAHWGGGPVSPPAYADLLARTSHAIRTADPGARILLAGLAPTTEVGPQNLSDVRYLDGLYDAGAAPHFDVVAAKPYGFDTGPHDRRVDEGVLNFSRLLLLREVMVDHGDEGKAVWASHWGWNALPEDWEGAPSIWGQTDEATQASRSVAAMERARQEWPWSGAMIMENFQPAVSLPTETVSPTLESGCADPRWGFSLVAPDGSPRPVYHAVADWAHSLPDAAPVGGYAAWNRWATYQGLWRVGPLGADVRQPAGDSASFRFDGTRVALTVRRGPYRAFLYVTVDGEPANVLPRDEAGHGYVVLYDEKPTIVTVPLASGLEPGPHRVEVTAEGGQGEWLLVDWRVGAAPVNDGITWKLVGLAALALSLGALLFREAQRIDWMSLAQGFLGGPEWAQTMSIVALTALFWATAALSWGREVSPTCASLLPTLCLLVSLVALLPLISLFMLRLDLGLTLIAFSAPFYLVPGGMFYGVLSLPEVLVVLCAVGCGLLYTAEVGLNRRRRPPTAPVGQSARPAPSRIAPRGSGHVAGIQDRHQSPSTHSRRAQNPGRGGLDLLVPTLPAWTGMDCAVALLVLAAIVSSAAAADRLAAAFELRAVFLLPALYYVLLRLTPLDRGARWRLVDGLVVGGLGVALVGLVQVALGRNLAVAEGGLRRLQSVFHSPNNVGLYLGRVWPLVLAALVVGNPVRPRVQSASVKSPHGRRGGRRWIHGLALAPVTLALALSFSRGTLLLALPAAVLTMGWLAGGRYRRAAVVIVLLGVLVLVPLLRVPRFAALLDLERGTTFFRLKLWRSSLRMIRDRPLLGVGPGNFLAAYRTRYVLPAAWEEFSLEHPHSIYLDHWTRLGLLGVVAGVAVQVSFWWRLGRRSERDPLTVGLAGSMAALLAHGLVDNAIFFPDLALAFFLLLALAVGERRTTDDE